MRTQSSSVDLAAAQAVERHAADGGEHARDDLLGGHFHAEDGDRAARVLGFTAAYSAMFTASVVLPIEGRPATITRSPGRRPPVSLSNSVKPVGRPRSLSGLLCHSSIWSMTPGSSVRTATAPSRLRKVPSAISKTFCSALIDQLARRLTVVVEHRRDDVGAGPDQLPQQRTLAHDIRVRAHVGGGGRIARDGAEVGKAARPLRACRCARAAARR